MQASRSFLVLCTFCLLGITQTARISRTVKAAETVAAQNRRVALKFSKGVYKKRIRITDGKRQSASQTQDWHVYGTLSGKSQCSEKDQALCSRSWKEESNWLYKNAAARCSWVPDLLPGNACVPNCLHANNQDERLCESSFCLWKADSKKCIFNPGKAKVRRAFCDRIAGKTDRRLVKANGFQPDFYAKIKDARKSAQRLFCRDMLGDDDDQLVADGHTPEEEILAGMMRCWRPNPADRASYRDKDLQATMKAEIGTLLTPLGHSPKLEMHPKVMATPILGGYFEHITVGLTDKRVADTWTSHCHEFSYPGAPGLDKAGCHFFRKSFAPVQGLVNCLRPKFENDVYAKLWQLVSEVAERENTTEGVLTLAADASVKDLTAATNNPNISFSNMLDQWKFCKKSGRYGACDRWLSSWLRALEIVKQVENDSWEGLDAAGIRELLRMRILGTIAVPPVYDWDPVHIPALQESTIEAMTQCFNVPPSGGSHTVLKESLRCMPMMWDYVQIPGLPMTALWPRHRDEPSEKEFPTAHPLCARMALAGLVRQYTRTKYPEVGWKLLRLGTMSDNTCLTVTGAQCVNFGDCFQNFMEKQVGKIHEFCGPPPVAGWFR